MSIQVQQGVGPQPLESPGAGAAYKSLPVVEVYVTSPLDLTQPHLGIELVPARPGYVPFNFDFSQWVILSTSGTQVTPATVQAGSNPAHNNYIASQSIPSNADVAAAVPPCGASPNANTLQTAGQQVFPGNAVILDVTAGAQGTGGFTLVARMTIQVRWISMEVG